MKALLALLILTLLRTAVFAAELQVIDAHVHTSYTNDKNDTSAILYTRDGLLKEFESANVVGAVSMMSRTGTGYDSELLKKRVAFCVGISESPDWNEIEAGLKSKKYSCIKIYLGYIHKFASDVLYAPAYPLAEKYDVPVVFHTGDVWDKDGMIKYADPMTIDEIAVEHRKVTLVIAHCGNPWIETAAEVAFKNPNVYLDGSAFLVGDLTRYSNAELEEQMVKPLRWIFNYIENPKKLMFGTDWPLVHAEEYLQVFLRAIPPEHWNKVFHDNAIRVYKLNLPILDPDEDSSEK